MDDEEPAPPDGNQRRSAIDAPALTTGPYPWDDWATEHRAQLLLEEALKTCAPDGQGNMRADEDALARLEETYNTHICEAITDVSRYKPMADGNFRVVLIFGDHRRSITWDAHHGWHQGMALIDANAARNTMLDDMRLPHHRMTTHCFRENAHDSLLKETNLLPPGPHRGCGWFGTVVRALTKPGHTADQSPRPLDALFCTAGPALARILIAIGDRRTAQEAAGTGRLSESFQEHRMRTRWRSTRKRLTSFLALMDRVYATWSLYVPLVLPTEHETNRGLIPGFVE